MVVLTSLKVPKESVGRLNTDGVLPYADLHIADDLPEPPPTDLEILLKDQGYLGGGLRMHTVDADLETTRLVYDASKFSHDQSAESAWEAIRVGRSRERVFARAEDWIDRLDALKRTVTAWTLEAVGDMTISDRPPVAMNEELMREYGVGVRQMPSFDVLRDGRPALRFQPRGLWTLGANGRVDLITPRTAPILVDRSRPMVPPAEWVVYDLRDRTQAHPFDRALFLYLVRTAVLP